MFATVAADELARRTRMERSLTAVNAEISRRTNRFAANSCNYATTGALAGASTLVEVRRTFEVHGRLARALNRPARRVTGIVTAHVAKDGTVTFVRPHGGPDVAFLRRLGLG